MLQELAACRKNSEAAVYACLQKIINDAEKFRQFHRKRHEKALQRSIQWGAEYDAYCSELLIPCISDGILLKESLDVLWSLLNTFHVRLRV